MKASPSPRVAAAHSTPSGVLGRSPRWMRWAVRLFRRVPRRLADFQASEIMAARTSELRVVARVPKAFSVRFAGSADEPLLARHFADPSRPRRWLQSGESCLLAWADGDVHAMEWIHRGPGAYGGDAARLGVEFEVPAGACWLHNGRNTRDGARGPWAIVMGRLRPFLEREGVGAAFLQVDVDDRYSAASHQSLGFRTVAWVVALHLVRTPLVGIRLAGRPWSRVRRVCDLRGVEV